MRDENDKQSADAITSSPHPSASGDQVRAGARLFPPPARLPDLSGPQSTADKGKSPPEHKDGLREVVETVVFVVVLVLLLKTFLAEAFVIPTGSMAETLFGYHKEVVCPECKYRFPINYSSEVDPQDNNPVTVTGSRGCPNCRVPIDFRRKFQP